MRVRPWRCSTGVRRVWLFFGVTSIVGVTAAALVPGCTTRECSASSYTYTGGRMVTPNQYETNDWNERWIPYPGDVTVNIDFPPGIQRQPISITGYVGTSDTPNGGVDFQGGQNWAITSGQLDEGFFVSNTGFSVTNSSCAVYSARFVVDFAPATLTLFGGVGNSGNGGLQTLGDTWTWDGSQWAQAVIVSDAMAGPTARSGAALTTLGSSQFFFGGVEGSGTYDADFWRWDGVTWSQIFVPCPPLDSGLGCFPFPRAYAAIAPLPNQPSSDGGTVNKLVLFGGRSVSTSASGPAAFAEDDTWIFDGTRWTKADPRTGSPPARWGATAFGFNGKVVLFGGFAGDLTPLGDTWIWDDQAQTWTQVPTGATGPSARALAAAAPYGTAAGPDVLLFGGTDGPNDLDDTWTWNGTSWSQVMVPGPGARSSAAMGTLGETVFLFGGLRAGVPLGDFWSWNGSAWQDLPQVSGASFPAARAGAGASGI
jgi:Galactose oxidase, central domain